LDIATDLGGFTGRYVNQERLPAFRAASTNEPGEFAERGKADSPADTRTRSGERAFLLQVNEKNEGLERPGSSGPFTLAARIAAKYAVVPAKRRFAGTIKPGADLQELVTSRSIRTARSRDRRRSDRCDGHC
jgi:hypothetical protein